MRDSSLGRRRDFRALVDELEGVALWTATRPGEFDYISAGFEDIWGVPPEDIEDDIERLLETVHPEDKDRVRANIEGSRYDETYESRIVRPDESVRWVLVQQVLLRDEAGGVSEVVGICTDITEQKRRERELELLNRIVRHDIRNDMAVVLGWAELLEEHVDDRGTEYLQRILASSEHVVELTDAAREYAATIASDEGLDLEPRPLRSVLETELSLRRESFPEAEFVLESRPPDVAVVGDRMLSSVFRNLLNNAVQHNDKETPRVTVSCELHDDEVDVRVADNGPGISDDHEESIFGKGDRGLDSLGMGLGLYLVDTLVTQYGGDIRVEKNEPTGSVFVVTLLLAD